MSNPFAGIISSEMKTLWKNMIDALLEDTALTLPCRPVYEGSKVEVIAGGNAVDPIGNKPAGVFLHGSPKFYPSGDAIQDASADGDTLYLCVIWSSKDFIKTTVTDSLINSGRMYVQMLCKIDDVVTVSQVDRLIIDEDIEGKIRHTFKRVSKPEPIGFGQSNHFIIMWERVDG